MRFSRCRFLLMLSFLLVACTKQPSAPATPFRPPTSQRPKVETSAPTSSPIQATSTPSCFNDLRYLEDLTISDGTIVAAGSELDKRWRVLNSGSCNWNESYSLQLIAGADLSAQQVQKLYPARAGAEATLRIRFTAPVEPGVVRSVWQAFSPQGEAFGDPIFIEVFVETPEQQE